MRFHQNHSMRMRKDLEPAACEASLQAIARLCMTDVRYSARKVSQGDADALHDMRIALTRLRTAIRFFKPVIVYKRWKALRRDASWLVSRSSMARDIDVALRHCNRTVDTARKWRQQRQRQYNGLKRVLRSKRYRRFVAALTRVAVPAVSKGRSPLPKAFTARRLEEWKSRLIVKGQHLDRLSVRKLHKLRLRAKRLKYALEWSLPMLENRAVAKKQLLQAKRIQDALGKLNDANMHNARAGSLDIKPLPFFARHGRRNSQRRLLGSAKDALKELQRLARKA